MNGPLAVQTAAFVALTITIVAIIVLLLIVLAPWRTVREEPPLDDTAETRLLLGDDPEEIARDQEAKRAAGRVTPRAVDLATPLPPLDDDDDTTSPGWNLPAS
jgi:hypothetical protein